MESIEVLYGADLSTSVYGSGFPTIEKQPFHDHTHHPMNLNILPFVHGSLFPMLTKSHLPGLTIPWLYIGMLFSTFCWHTEDHHCYSLNYHHGGDTKTWYGVPGDHAARLESLFQTLVPDLFTKNPDILFHLTTLISPSLLKHHHIPVVGCHQRPGEFVLTLPNAYHCGFNQGLTVNEAVNFVVPDWLAYGEACVQVYQHFHWPPCFSHDELLVQVARLPSPELKWDTCVHLAPQLKNLLARCTDVFHLVQRLWSPSSTRSASETTHPTLTSKASTSSTKKDDEDHETMKEERKETSSSPCQHRSLEENEKEDQETKKYTLLWLNPPQATEVHSFNWTCDDAHQCSVCKTYCWYVAFYCRTHLVTCHLHRCACISATTLSLRCTLDQLRSLVQPIIDKVEGPLQLARELRALLNPGQPCSLDQVTQWYHRVLERRRPSSSILVTPTPTPTLAVLPSPPSSSTSISLLDEGSFLLQPPSSSYLHFEWVFHVVRYLQHVHRWLTKTKRFFKLKKRKRNRDHYFNGGEDEREREEEEEEERGGVMKKKKTNASLHALESFYFYPHRKKKCPELAQRLFEEGWQFYLDLPELQLFPPLLIQVHVLEHHAKLLLTYPHTCLDECLWFLEQCEQTYLQIPSHGDVQHLVNQLQWRQTALHALTSGDLDQVVEALHTSMSSDIALDPLDTWVRVLKRKKELGETWNVCAQDLLAMEKIPLSEFHQLRLQSDELPIHPGLRHRVVDLHGKIQRWFQTVHAMLQAHPKSIHLHTEDMKDVLLKIQQLPIEQPTQVMENIIDVLHQLAEWATKVKKLFVKPNLNRKLETVLMEWCLALTYTCDLVHDVYIDEQHQDTLLGSWSSSSSSSSGCSSSIPLSTLSSMTMPSTTASSSSSTLLHQTSPLVSSHQEKEQKSHYCFCRQRDFGYMIGCQRCGEYYHCGCLKISKREAKKLTYICPVCDLSLAVPRRTGHGTIPSLATLQEVVHEASKFPFVPTDLHFLQQILDLMLPFQHHLQSYLQSKKSLFHVQDLPILRFYLRKLEGCEIEIPELSILRHHVLVLTQQAKHLYCLCQSPGTPQVSMIQCETCFDWFHFPCVGLTSSLVHQLQEFQCPLCCLKNHTTYPFEHVPLSIHYPPYAMYLEELETKQPLVVVCNKEVEEEEKEEKGSVPFTTPTPTTLKETNGIKKAVSLDTDVVVESITLSPPSSSTNGVVDQLTVLPSSSCPTPTSTTFPSLPPNATTTHTHATSCSLSILDDPLMSQSTPEPLHPVVSHSDQAPSIHNAFVAMPSSGKRDPVSTIHATTPTPSVLLNLTSSNQTPMKRKRKPKNPAVTNVSIPSSSSSSSSSSSFVPSEIHSGHLTPSSTTTTMTKVASSLSTPSSPPDSLSKVPPKPLVPPNHLETLHGTSFSCSDSGISTSSSYSLPYVTQTSSSSFETQLQLEESLGGMSHSSSAVTNTNGTEKNPMDSILQTNNTSHLTTEMEMPPKKRRKRNEKETVEQKEEKKRLKKELKRIEKEEKKKLKLLHSPKEPKKRRGTKRSQTSSLSNALDQVSSEVIPSILNSTLLMNTSLVTLDGQDDNKEKLGLPEILAVPGLDPVLSTEKRKTKRKKKTVSEPTLDGTLEPTALSLSSSLSNTATLTASVDGVTPVKTKRPYKRRQKVDPVPSSVTSNTPTIITSEVTTDSLLGSLSSTLSISSRLLPSHEQTLSSSSTVSSTATATTTATTSLASAAVCGASIEASPFLTIGADHIFPSMQSPSFLSPSSSSVSCPTPLSIMAHPPSTLDSSLSNNPFSSTPLLHHPVSTTTKMTPESSNVYLENRDTGLPSNSLHSIPHPSLLYATPTSCSTSTTLNHLPTTASLPIPNPTFPPHLSTPSSTTSTPSSSTTTGPTVYLPYSYLYSLPLYYYNTRPPTSASFPHTSITSTLGTTTSATFSPPPPPPLPSSSSSTSSTVDAPFSSAPQPPLTPLTPSTWPYSYLPYPNGSTSTTETYPTHHVPSSTSSSSSTLSSVSLSPLQQPPPPPPSSSSITSTPISSPPPIPWVSVPPIKKVGSSTLTPFSEVSKRLALVSSPSVAAKSGSKDPSEKS
ncbi:hypothetical protein HMI55_005005 [Coelomomyces lativittatus]|nr:hypothetical protein HMI56_007663 [Coelomomyces lativittatus]KAJ1514045.1 hypothetical protein HMI55_005005 [Coelomomyces lativittatus]